MGASKPAWNTQQLKPKWLRTPSVQGVLRKIQLQPCRVFWWKRVGGQTGLVREAPSHARASDPLSSVFSSLLTKKADTILGVYFGVVLAMPVANPLTPTPSATLWQRSPLLEMVFARRWAGVRLLQSFWNCLDFPEVPRTSPKVPWRLPRNFSYCGYQEPSRGSPEVPLTSHKLPGPQTLSVGSLTPSHDSQRTPLTLVTVTPLLQATSKNSFALVPAVAVEGLVKETQLAIYVLLVTWVCEDTTIEKGPHSTRSIMSGCRCHFAPLKQQIDLGNRIPWDFPNNWQPLYLQKIRER